MCIFKFIFNNFNIYNFFFHKYIIILFYIWIKIIIFYIIIKWGYGEFRFNSSFYLMFYTLIYSLPLSYLLFNLLELFDRLNFYILEIFNIINLNNFKFIYIILSFLVKIPISLCDNFFGDRFKRSIES